MEMEPKGSVKIIVRLKGGVLEEDGMLGLIFR